MFEEIYVVRPLEACILTPTERETMGSIAFRTQEEAERFATSRAMEAYLTTIDVVSSGGGGRQQWTVSTEDKETGDLTPVAIIDRVGVYSC